MNDTQEKQLSKDERDETILFNMRMKESLKKRVVAYAEKNDLNTSQAIRRFIERGLSGF